jgi:hypothetical protein
MNLFMYLFVFVFFWMTHGLTLSSRYDAYIPQPTSQPVPLEGPASVPLVTERAQQKPDQTVSQPQTAQKLPISFWKLWRRKLLIGSVGILVIGCWGCLDLETKQSVIYQIKTEVIAFFRQIVQFIVWELLGGIRRDVGQLVRDLS